MRQLIVSSIVEGCALGVLAMSFALISNTLRVFHLAFGALYAIAAYAFYAGLGWYGLAVSVLLGMATEIFVYYPLFKRRASLSATFVSSLGVYIVLTNVVILLFQNDTRLLSQTARRTFYFGKILFTDVQLSIVAYGIIACIVLAVALNHTSFGISMQAVGDNLRLLQVLRGKISFLRLAAIGIGTAASGVVAILKGLDTGIDPQIGMGAVLSAAVVVIFSGGRNYLIAFLSGMLFGLLKYISIWFLAAQWAESVTFIALIIALIVRRRGLYAPPERLEES